MKNAMGIVVCTLGLALLAAPTAALGAPQPKVPPVVALMVSFYDEIDLESGQTCSGGIIGVPPPLPCPVPPDLHFAFNATRATPTVLFQRDGQIAMLLGVPFAAVDAVAITNGVVFSDELQDVPFGPNDTAIIHTIEGNYFKVGLALCYWPASDGFPGCAPVASATPGTYGVRFQYQQLR